MKKKYQKPVLAFESFELSGVIAGNCEYIANFAIGKCSYTDEAFGEIFINGISACLATTPDGYDGICYHVLNENSKLFNS